MRSGAFSGKSIMMQPTWMGDGWDHPAQASNMGFSTAAAFSGFTKRKDDALDVDEAAQMNQSNRMVSGIG